MENEKIKTILIDLDGVLNEYSGKFCEKEIPKIRTGAREFLINLSKKYFIKIFTTRNKIQTVKWLIDNKLDNIISDVTDIKQPAWLYIDDRCINFNGDYKDIIEQIDNFKTWYTH